MTDDERVLWGVVANARTSAASYLRTLPLWALVCRATGLGSTAATALCRRFGFDPDSTSAATDKGARETVATTSAAHWVESVPCVAGACPHQYLCDDIGGCRKAGR
jgi:hypothetical protein